MTRIVGIVGIVLFVTQPIVGREQPSLERVLTIARSGRQYRPATPLELDRCGALFVRTLSDPRRPGLDQDWRQLGFRFIQLADAETEMWVVVEDPRRKRGWGCYLICPQHLPGIVLQAPHSYADRYTGTVALRLFRDGRFGAVAWNTVPRKIIDVAHTSDHVFSTFTQALVDVYPESAVVQVHGFSQDKRLTVVAGATDLIVSDGTRAPNRSVRKLVVTLQTSFPYGQVQLFPTEVQELGATQNVQGKLVRRSGSSQFVHLEMSQDLRLRLVNDPLAREVFLKNLADCVD